MPFDPPFSGYIQPPGIPPDPTGDCWRGPPGPQGPTGAPGDMGEAPLDGFSYGRVNNAWVSGGILSGPLTAPYLAVPGADDSLSVAALSLGQYTHTSTSLQPRPAIGINWDFNSVGGAVNVGNVINTITDVYGLPNTWVWPLNVQLNLRTTGNNNSQHVASASTVRRYSGATPAWAYFGQHIDLTGVPPSATSQQVGCELDLSGNGPDGAASPYDPHAGARTHVNLVNNSYLAPAWTANAAHAVGDAVRANPTNGFTYVAQTAGTSGSTQPTWPLTAGTVTDGTVTWAFGTSVPYQVSRAINIGSATQASYGAAIHTIGPFYDAILEFSHATLDTATNPNAAAIRLAPEMPIDFSGGKSLATQNLHTLSYTATGTPRLRYMAGGNEVWSVSDAGSVTGVGVVVPPGGSIQAAHDALPATGGAVVLSRNTVYDVTATINITKPNVRVMADGWSTILRRNAAFSTGAIVYATGASCTIEGFTVDGNSVVSTQWEVQAAGDNSVVRNMHITNSAGTVNLGLMGQNSRATGNTITGLGISLSTERGYGIWAINHKTVLIDNNTITGTGIDGIGFDGEGSRVIGNYVAGCHCWNTSQGGQIASYSGASAGNAVSIIGNTIGPPGSLAQGTGIESWIPNTTLNGNSIEGIKGAAVTVFGNGTVITGNAIKNCGGTADAIVVTGNVTDFVISGNRIADDQITPTMRYGVAIYAGTSDRFMISNNLITGNTGVAIYNLGTGTNFLIINNQGNNDYGLPRTGGTIAGNLTIGQDSNLQAVLNVNGAASGFIRRMQFETNSAVRWHFGMINNETGAGNAGSDLYVNCYTDAAGFVSQPLLITRATGAVTVGGGGLKVIGTVGFNNTAPVAKPTVSGAKGSNAALASLLAALAAYGLITDSSTA